MFDSRKKLNLLFITVLLISNSACLDRQFIDGHVELISSSDTTLNDSSIILGHVFRLDYPDNLPYSDNEFEIWLEDLTTGEGWILISENENTYTFNGLPDEPADRFRIHIQDANAITGLDEQNHIDPLKIYSAGDKVYIKNPEGVEITNIRIFNLLGQHVQHKINYASLDLSMVQIDEPAGYYITQVTVDKHVYTEKVFIKN